MGERCQERERLLSWWTDCSNHVRKLGDEQVAAIKDGSTQMFHGNAVPGFAWYHIRCALNHRLPSVIFVTPCPTGSHGSQNRFVGFVGEHPPVATNVHGTQLEQ